MLLRSTGRFLALAVLAVFVAGLSADGLLAQSNSNRNRNRNRNDRNRTAQQQKQQISRSINAHKQVIENAKAAAAKAAQVAQAASYKAQTEQGAIETAKSHIANLEAYSNTISGDLARVEREYIQTLPADSKLPQAMAEAEQAKRDYDAVRRDVFNSPAYKAAYQRALASRNKAQELPKVRETFINSSEELQAAESALSSANKRLEVVRQEVLGENQDWKTAIAEVRSTNAELSQAKAALQNGLLGRMSAAANYRDAQQTASAAAEAIARSEAKIKSLQSQQKRIEQQQRNSNNRNRNRNRSSGNR